MIWYPEFCSCWQQVLEGHSCCLPRFSAFSSHYNNCYWPKNKVKRKENLCSFSKAFISETRCSNPEDEGSGMVLGKKIAIGIFKKMFTLDRSFPHLDRRFHQKMIQWDQRLKWDLELLVLGLQCRRFPIDTTLKVPLWGPIVSQLRPCASCQSWQQSIHGDVELNKVWSAFKKNQIKINSLYVKVYDQLLKINKIKNQFLLPVFFFNGDVAEIIEDRSGCCDPNSSSKFLIWRDVKEIDMMKLTDYERVVLVMSWGLTSTEQCIFRAPF